MNSCTHGIIVLPSENVFPTNCWSVTKPPDRCFSPDLSGRGKGPTTRTASRSRLPRGRPRVLQKRASGPAVQSPRGLSRAWRGANPRCQGKDPRDNDRHQNASVFADGLCEFDPVNSSCCGKVRTALGALANDVGVRCQVSASRPLPRP